MHFRFTAVAAALAASVATALPQEAPEAEMNITSAGPGGRPGGPGGPRPPPTGPPGCPQIAPGPVPFSSIPGLFAAPVPTDLYAMEAIRQTTALYAAAIDGRDFEALRKVFVPNVYTNYSDPFDVIIGVEPLMAALEPGLATFASTQHLLGTQLIQVCSPTTAVSITYFQATHFFTPYRGVGNPVGNDQVLIDRAQYQDVWAKQRDGTWKITNRNLFRMGPGTLDGGFPSVPDMRTFVNGP